MVKSKNRLVAFMLLIMMTLTMLLSYFTPVKVEAAASDAYTNLITVCMSGDITYTKGTKNKIINVASNRYKMSSGGTILYVSLWNTGAAADQSADLFTSDLGGSQRASACLRTISSRRQIQSTPRFLDK